MCTIKFQALWFTWTFLMAYPKAKFKPMVIEHLLVFKGFLIGNFCLPRFCYSFCLDTLLLLALLVSSNSLRILCSTSLLTESRDFFKSINFSHTASLYSHCLSSIWHMHNKWSVVDLLHWNPHWWSLIISSAYQANLDRRMFFYNILYVVGKPDLPV
jgi:uncharacterized membrane protein